MNPFIDTDQSKKLRVFASLIEKINSLSDWVLIGWITLIYFVLRTLSLPVFEVSGDAAWKWCFLRYYHETGIWFPLSLDHHQGRWAQNMPAYWLMELFDSSAPWLAAVLQMTAGFVLLLLIWQIARLFTSKAGAVGAVLMTACNPVFASESAQFLPSLPSTMYVLLTLYLILLYIRNPKLWYLPLAAGVTMGLAWGCKVTAVYWAAGMGLFLLFYPVSTKNIISWKRFRIGWDVLLLFLGFLAVIIPETLIINDSFDVKFGRINMLQRHAGPSEVRGGLTIWEYIFYPVILFFDFSGRFLNTGVKALLFLLAMPLAIVQFRKKDQPLEQKFLLFTMFTAVIIHCYFIVSVSPITHPERPLIRYLFTLFCVWNIIIVSYWHNIFQLGKGKIGKYIRGAYGAGFLVLCILLFANAVNEPLVKSDNLFSKIKVYQYMKQQKEKDLPVLIRYKKGRDFDTRTFKLIIAYKTFFGKTCELSLLRSRKEEYMKKEPVQCEKGYLYFLFDGRKPAPGETCKCIVITRDNVRMKELTFQKYSENLEK